MLMVLLGLHMVSLVVVSDVLSIIPCAWSSQKSYSKCDNIVQHGLRLGNTGPIECKSHGLEAVRTAGENECEQAPTGSRRRLEMCRGTMLTSQPGCTWLANQVPSAVLTEAFVAGEVGVARPVLTNVTFEESYTGAASEVTYRVGVGYRADLGNRAATVCQRWSCSPGQ